MLKQLMTSLQSTRADRRVRAATRHLDPHILRDIGLDPPRNDMRRPLPVSLIGR